MNKSIIRQIKRLRKNNHLTRLELANKINVTEEAILSWEKGTAIPTYDNIITIYKIFGYAVHFGEANILAYGTQKLIFTALICLLSVTLVIVGFFAFYIWFSLFLEYESSNDGINNNYYLHDLIFITIVFFVNIFALVWCVVKAKKIKKILKKEGVKNEAERNF